MDMIVELKKEWLAADEARRNWMGAIYYRGRMIPSYAKIYRRYKKASEALNECGINGNISV